MPSQNGNRSASLDTRTASGGDGICSASLDAGDFWGRGPKSHQKGRLETQFPRPSCAFRAAEVVEAFISRGDSICKWPEMLYRLCFLAPLPRCSKMLEQMFLPLRKGSGSEAVAEIEVESIIFARKTDYSSVIVR